MTDIKLNDEQRAAVTTTAADAVVIAGPGSGKTRVLVARVLELIRRGAAPESIVIITYTNAAADEIRARLNIEKPDMPFGYCGTLHGYALRLLERYGGQIRWFTTNIVVMDEERAEAAFEEYAKALGFKGTKAALETSRRSLMDRAGLPQFVGVKPQGADLVVASWFANMLTTGAFDFDGILYWGVGLLRSTRRIQNVPSHPVNLLVDEAQDMANIDALFYAALPCISRFVVGDPDQAIFGFRGGNPSHVIGYANSPEWATFKLEGNYRCGSDICEVANILIRHSAKRVPKLSISRTGFYGSVETCYVPSAAHEQKVLAENIRNQDPNQCAVLLRTNALVDDYAKALESYSIPIARRKERERPKDWRLCKAALTALANPENDAVMLWLIGLAYDSDAAKRARLAAAQARQGVNAVCVRLPAGVTPKTAPDHLAWLHVGPESIALAREALDRSATIADALLLLAQEERVSVTTGEGVTVCTMHSAKGQEWETVYLPAFEQAIIPGRWKDVDIEEERRLVFVAVTRAKWRLILSGANERKPNQWATVAPAERSQFIGEMAS